MKSLEQRDGTRQSRLGTGPKKLKILFLFEFQIIQFSSKKLSNITKQIQL